ncbi:hypothetical protein [Aliiroseovarius sediminis]|uniref:CBU_0592 family membrane protein n=1 Tax=Aliiroseovarius sediminis TaxID=2925839 RepID=UPI001F577A61|nr:hypothetical protein [Aliiroseovarius sediminis]MCI2394985.1 hypothetical protein [Aliiroseovarius sediminis]
MSNYGSLDGWEMVGLLGAVIYCTNYSMMAFDVITSKKACYYALQFMAASCVTLSLTVHFNVAALAIQLFFLVVSIIGFANHARGRSAPSGKDRRTV